MIGPDWRGTIRTGARHSYRVCDSTGQRQDCVVAINRHGLHKDIALMVRKAKKVQAWGAESLSAVGIGLRGMKRVATIDAAGRSFSVFYRFSASFAKSGIRQVRENIR